MTVTNGRLFALGWLALVGGMLGFLFYLGIQVKRLTDLAIRTEQRLDRLESGLSNAVEASKERIWKMEDSLRPLAEKASESVDPLMDKVKDPRMREAVAGAKEAAAGWLKRRLEEKQEGAEAGK